jgi:hypothetical protein
MGSFPRVKGFPVKGSFGDRPHVASLSKYLVSVVLSTVFPEGSVIGWDIMALVKGSINSIGTGAGFFSSSSSSSTSSSLLFLPLNDEDEEEVEGDLETDEDAEEEEAPFPSESVVP